MPSCRPKLTLCRCHHKVPVTVMHQLSCTFPGNPSLRPAVLISVAAASCISFTSRTVEIPERQGQGRVSHQHSHSFEDKPCDWGGSSKELQS